MGNQANKVKMDKKIRVLLVDDHALVRQGLISLLGSQPDIEIVGEAADGSQAVAMARRHLPDVVLMDIDMPIMNGIEATKLICSERPGACVIGLSMWNDDNHRSIMQDAGAILFLSKDSKGKDFLAAIRNGRITANTQNIDKRLYP